MMRLSCSSSAKRIYLSAPHLGGEELGFVQDAFASNYIAPIGPQVDAFEQEFADRVGSRHATAVSSGTAALHLLLRYAGVGVGDEVICSTLTFVASVNPIVYLGGMPVFIDSDCTSWNMNPEILATELEKRSGENRLPKAVVLVHLYGQSADIDPIKKVCNRFNVVLLEDAAEALGANYKGQAPGTFGLAGFYSFNGNKIITTSGGGMIVSDNEDLIRKVKFWATQAKDNAVHYEHSEIGYNYRMSNVLAAIGRGQLQVLKKRVAQKRAIFDFYQKHLEHLPGISFMPEADYGMATRWLTCLTIDPSQFGTNRDAVRLALERENIEARPVWKPMHMQPVFSNCTVVGGSVAERLFATGLCLPSGTALNDSDLQRIVDIVTRCYKM